VTEQLDLFRKGVSTYVALAAGIAAIAVAVWTSGATRTYSLIVIISVLAVLGIARLVGDWRREEDRPAEPPETPEFLPASAPTRQSTVAPSDEDEGDEEDDGDDSLPPPPAARHHVRRDRTVVLTLRSNGAYLMFNPGPVQCEVICPNGDRALGKAVFQSPPPWRGTLAALGFSGPREANLIFPTEFEGAPDKPPLGPYHVTWTLPNAILGAFAPRVEHDAFRIQRRPATADPAGNPAAVALSSMTKNEQRETAQGLLDRGAALRTTETNYRGPDDRDLAGTPTGWKNVNAWLIEVLASLEVHFASEAYRVSSLGKLTVTATTNQILQVIDEAVKPLHNWRNELAKP
jgi:hypothetical protein